MTDREELAAQNRALTEELKRFFRFEQRLGRTQRELERQLHRFGALNELALAASGESDETALLQSALGLVLSLFPYDQAVAFLPGPDGILRASGAVAAPGLAGPSVERLEARPSAGVPASVAPEQPTTEPDDALAPVLAAADALFATASEALATLVVPLRSEGRPAGLLLARKIDPLLPYATSLAADEDLPFLRLLANHVESALDGARLRARLSAVIAQLPSAIMVLRGGRLVHGNAAAARILGKRSSWAELVPAEDAGLLDQLEQSVARDGAVRLLERRLLGPDGQLLPVEIVALSFTFEGEPATLVIVEDLTERQRMSTELALSERLATVGALAAGVAHEVNNPLTYVLHHLERLAARVPEELRPSALAALDGAGRIRDIVRDLQTFARADREQIEPVDVHAVLEKVLALAGPQLRYRAHVTRLYGEPIWALASESRLAQVFLNLAINAAHAMARGGVDDNELRVRTWPEGERVAIEIADTGDGIDPTVLPRVFEPFFTTKGSTGSGLGLSICRNLVESFGGTIEVTSALGRGSRFTVRLPAASARSGVVPPTSRERPGRAKVLVVDDDPRLSTVLASLLGSSHDVTTVLGGAAAVDRLESGSFDVILCDVMMPDVSGLDVHRWASLFRPELAERFVFLTGGAVTRESQERLTKSGRRVLSKPTRATDLEEAIADVLRRAPG